MSAAPTDRSLWERNPALFERLHEIARDPATSRGFQAVLMQISSGWMGLAYDPVDLSIGSIQAVSLASVKRDRKEHRKRKKAGKFTVWPECFDSFIRTSRNGCRFAKWCRGDCEPTNQGERNHFSAFHSVSELTFGDRLGVEVYRYEAVDGVLAAPRVELMWQAGDSFDCEAVSLSPEQARKFGGEVFIAADVKSRHDVRPGPLVDLPTDLGGRLSVEVLPERRRRDGTTNRETYEFTLDVAQGRHIRVAVDRSAAWFLGRYLIIAANDAEGRYVPIPHTPADVAGVLA